jgi:Uma2 family endonuclease
MMTATTFVPAGFPLTLRERALAPALLRAKATFDEYVEFSENCPYNVEYYNGEIISMHDVDYIDDSLIAMSRASAFHESLVGRFITVLNNLFDDDDTIQVFSSNILIHIAATGNSFNADVSIVRGETDYLRLPSGLLSTSEIQNPALVVEVLSKSTMAFDQDEKLDEYQQIPVLQQVVFVSQHKLLVTSYRRSETPGVWLNTSYRALTESVPVLNKSVLVSDIYRKFKFD